MSVRDGVVVARKAAALFAFGCAFLFAVSNAVAQNACQKDEVFGGYSWLAPNGWGDLDYKINNIPNAFDASNTYYLPNAHNFGLLVDGSGHFRGGTTPPNLQNGSNDSTAVGYALGGLQYKFHGEKLSPFVRGFLGGASISPDCCHGNEWSFAAGGGGGLDYNINRRFSLRLIQADYIYSSYSHFYPSTHPTTWNSARLAAGLVINFGNYCVPQAEPKCTVTASPSPAEVYAGEPVRLSSTVSSFDPRHPLAYSWTTSGGKLSGATSDSAQIDTNGLADGTYTVMAAVTDPKLKKMNLAKCSATFMVKPPHIPPPPSVTCAPLSATGAAGQPSTITLAVTNPDNLPLTYAWSATAGQLVGNGTSASLTPSNNEAGSTITVTATVTDDRSRSASTSCEVRVPRLPPPCVTPVERAKCTFEQKGKPPARVDNDCKDILDGLATALQQQPGERLIIVGFADQSEASSSLNLAAQRAENAKYYLTTDGSTKIDADRIEARQGGSEGKITRFYFVPQGVLCAPPPDLGTAVDETKVKGYTRTTRASHKHAAPKAAPAQ